MAFKDIPIRKDGEGFVSGSWFNVLRQEGNEVGFRWW